jgi:hypothetical protein
VIKKSQLRLGQVLYYSDKQMYKSHHLVTGILDYGFYCITSDFLGPNFLTEERSCGKGANVRPGVFIKGFNDMKNCLIVPDQFLGPVSLNFNSAKAPLLCGEKWEKFSLLRSRNEEYKNKIKSTDNIPNSGMKVGAVFFDSKNHFLAIVTHFTSEKVFYLKGFSLRYSQFSDLDHLRGCLDMVETEHWVRVPDSLLTITSIKEEEQTISFGGLRKADLKKRSEEFVERIKSLNE